MRLRDKTLTLAVALAVLLTAAACNPAEKFTVVEAAMPTLNGLSSLHGTATAMNESRKDLTIENAIIAVKYRDRQIATARLLLPIELPADGIGGIGDESGSPTPIRYDFALEGLTPATLMTLQTRLLLNPAAFTVDLTAWARWGRIRKKIELKDVEATRLMGYFF
jgi:hypothetical protein